MGTESEVGNASGCHAGLVDVTGAQIQARSDPERIVLSAASPQCLELDVHGEIGVAAFVSQKARRSIAIDRPEIDVAIVVDVGRRDRQRTSCSRARRQQCGAIEIFAAAIVAEYEQRWRFSIGGGFRADYEVEPAVIVIIEKSRRLDI